MTMSTQFQSVMHSAAYWIQLALLEAFGPAQQSDESDPIMGLKRKYGRPITPSWQRKR